MTLYRKSKPQYRNHQIIFPQYHDIPQEKQIFKKPNRSLAPIIALQRNAPAAELRNNSNAPDQIQQNCQSRILDSKSQQRPSKKVSIFQTEKKNKSVQKIVSDAGEKIEFLQPHSMKKRQKSPFSRKFQRLKQQKKKKKRQYLINQEAFGIICTPIKLEKKQKDKRLQIIKQYAFMVRNVNLIAEMQKYYNGPEVYSVQQNDSKKLIIKDKSTVVTLLSAKHVGYSKQCPLCLQEFVDEKIFLFCFHEFHFQCLETYIRKTAKKFSCNIETGYEVFQIKCPLCKADIMEGFRNANQYQDIPQQNISQNALENSHINGRQVENQEKQQMFDNRNPENNIFLSDC